METSVIQRVMTLLEKKKMSILQLAKDLNMHDTTLNRQLKGQSAIAGSTILAIILKFPDISAEWLLRGEGAMERVNNIEKSEKVIVNQPNNSDNSGVNLSADTIMMDRLLGEMEKMREQNEKLIEQNGKLTDLLMSKL